MFHKGKTVLVLANKKQTSAEMVKRVAEMYKSIPKWMRDLIKISSDNVNTFELSTGSRIVAQATTEDAGRGYAVSFLVVDEAAFVDGMDGIWKALYPVLSTGGSALLLSTPNSAAGFFYDMWQSAVEGTNEFHPVKLPWDVHPDRDLRWLEKTKANMSEKDFAIEYGCDFTMSGDTFIDGKELERIEKRLIREPSDKGEFDRNLWIWKEVEQGGSYLLAADVARGDGQDFSTFHIIDLRTMEQVAEYRGKPTPDHFSRILDKWGRYYNEALIVVEYNTFGYVVSKGLEDLEYPRIFYSKKKSGEFVEAYDAMYMDDAIPGFTTTGNTRAWALDKLEEYIRTHTLTIRSVRLLNELRNFIWRVTARGSKLQAAENKNDDLVMAMAIACYVRDTAILQNERAINYDKALLDAMFVKKKPSRVEEIDQMIGFDRNYNIVKAPSGEDERSQVERQIKKKALIIW